MSKKRKSKEFQRLKGLVHYWQSQVRIESRWLKGSKENVRRFAKAMQKELEK
jgi:hypothetical protein